MSEIGLLLPFLEASVRLATPLALAALGETIAQRAGVLNIGIEGCLVSGAFAAAVGSLWLGGSGAGILLALLAGMAVAAVFSFFALTLRANAIVVGTAVTLGALGFTGAAYQGLFGMTGTPLSLPSIPPLPIPLLSEIPIAGPLLFQGPLTVPLTLLLAPLLGRFLFGTATGLELRAVGEAPHAARALGIRGLGLRWGATLWGGALAGLAGAHLALAHTGTFTPGISAGKGFMAIAVVVLGKWSPLRILPAALFFGAASAFQFFLQAVGLDLPYPVVLAFPYLLTLAALGGWMGQVRAPAGLALPWPRREE